MSFEFSSLVPPQNLPPTAEGRSAQGVPRLPLAPWRLFGIPLLLTWNGTAPGTDRKTPRRLKGSEACPEAQAVDDQLVLDMLNEAREVCHSAEVRRSPLLSFCPCPFHAMWGEDWRPSARQGCQAVPVLGAVGWTGQEPLVGLSPTGLTIALLSSHSPIE